MHGTAWLAHSRGKQVIQMARRETGSNAHIFPEFSRTSWSSSCPEIVMNNLAWKCTNYIWLESACNVHHKYDHEIIQNSIHKKIRSKIVLAHKLQFKISPRISNEIARFKLHSTLCQRHYLNHMAIARIKEFEFQPSWCAAVKIVWIWFQWVKTDGVDWCRKWIVVIV